MSLVHKATFPAYIRQISHMLLWLRNILVKTPLEKRVQRSLELASEEALVNAILHGYRGKGGPIMLEVRELPSQIEIEIQDFGPAFNPLEHPNLPDLEGDISRRREGGLGLFFIKQCVDELAYQREEKTNRFTLIKRFSQKRSE